MPKKSAKKKRKVPSTNPCFGCKGECCQYFAVYIDEPTDLDEYDAIKWYLHHKKVCVYIDKEDDWYVHVDNQCKQLVKGDRCKIYESRPNVCRDYKHDACERTDVDGGNIAEFYSVDALNEFFKLNFRVVGKDLKRRHRRYKTA